MAATRAPEAREASASWWALGGGGGGGDGSASDTASEADSEAASSASAAAGPYGQGDAEAEAEAARLYEVLLDYMLISLPLEQLPAALRKGSRTNGITVIRAQRPQPGGGRGGKGEEEEDTEDEDTEDEYTEDEVGGGCGRGVEGPVCLDDGPHTTPRRTLRTRTTLR